MEKIMELNERNFDDQVTQSDKPTLVEFWKEECDPCDRLSPVLDEIAERYDEELQIAKFQVDGETSASIADRYYINAVPQLIIFKNGKVIGWIKGYRSLPELSISVDTILRTSKSDEGENSTQRWLPYENHF